MWQTIRRYIWWTERRGSFHYDVMVTLILAFLFLSPRFINFHDQPKTAPYGADIAASHDGERQVLLDAADVRTAGGSPEGYLQRSGRLGGHERVDHSEELHDSDGNITAYRVFITTTR